MGRNRLNGPISYSYLNGASCPRAPAASGPPRLARRRSSQAEPAGPSRGGLVMSAEEQMLLVWKNKC